MASALKQLISERPSLDDVQKAIDEIANDAPRSAAIVGATFLEDVTQLSLLTKMVADLSKDEIDRLFIGTAPLSSFSAKINMAHALGLVGSKAKHDLDTIREIRNAFAHAKVSVNFDTLAIANAISGLHFRKLIDDWDKLPNQKRFRGIVRLLMIYLISTWTKHTEDMTMIRSFDLPSLVEALTFEKR